MKRLLIACLALALSACGGGSGGAAGTGFTISGSISGLAAGEHFTLQNNGGTAVTVNANGSFSYPIPADYNGSYSITVGTQPTGQVCTVSNGSGAGVVADITNVDVVCSANTFSVAGSVSGLAAGAQVTLLNNAADALTVGANGSFAFKTPVVYNSSYSVTVGTQPTGQVCTVSSGAGSGVVANISNVSVVCSANTYAVGGSVSGLATGSQVTLLNNGGNALTVGANGAFAFTTPVVYNSSYAVTVGTQPVGQVCTVSSGSGSGVVANISNVSVTCSTNTYTVGGSVSGLATGAQVTLLNNSGNALTVNANGAFTFTTPVVYNSSYAVTVGTQPTGQVCTVSSGSGSGVVANISNVSVTCSASTFTVGGSVSGLATGAQVTLLNNGGNALTVSANGTFKFTTPVVYNSSYAVTVGTQPTGQVCTVSSGSGSGVVANISTVSVTCSSNTFTVGGSVSGLATGAQVTLLNNGGNALTVVANGTFKFTTPVVYNSSYAVTVGTQPTGQMCSVTSGVGSGVAANISNVSVSCTSLAIRVSGSSLVDGSGKTVQLRGMNVAGLELVSIGGWTNDPWGQQTGTTVPQWATMAAWGANAVRLPLNETSWLGFTCTNTDGSTHNPDPGGNYRATVASSVAAAQANGLYVILDLHWTAPGKYCARNQDKMADADNAVNFWTSVATTFKGNPGVLFEMFNEPMVYDQTALLNGTTWPQTLSPGSGAPLNYSWSSAGMNTLIAAVRATGATNVVLVGNLNYDSDLSQWTRPTDPLNQYAAVWHAYPAFGATFGTAAWTLPNYGQAAYDAAKAILTAGVPVVITEYGDHNATGTTSAPFASKLLPWADTNGVSYLGWSWDTWGDSDFVLIKDGAGTPTDGYGTYVKQHYQCRAAGTATCP